MLDASRKHSSLVTQVVPSPFGLKGHDVMVELLSQDYLGELREIHAYSLTGALADAASPLSWRQDASLSGYNTLTLGILHETLCRWVPPPVRVLAQVHAFIASRIDPESGVRRRVGTPDSVQAMTILENGARAAYQISGVTPFGQGMGIRLYGSEGTLFYDLNADRIWGVNRRQGAQSAKAEALEEIAIPPEKAREWQVEADFVNAIRQGTPIRFTDFETGVAYLEFTEAVAKSAQGGTAVDLPLA